MSVEGVSELRAFQRFNHFPAMSEISKKDSLARNILKICKVMPQDFDFVPKTWIMPTDYSSLLTYAIDMKKMNQKRTYIMKPANGAMGHGIKLFKSVERIQPTENYIVQEYIANPYLLDGYKFDMRIYVLVTSCDPLRAFIYNNGLVRLGTEQYQEPHESNIVSFFLHMYWKTPLFPYQRYVHFQMQITLYLDQLIAEHNSVLKYSFSLLLNQVLC